MINREKIAHITTVTLLVAFIVLGLACASTSNAVGTGSYSVYFYGNGASGTGPNEHKTQPNSAIILPGPEGLHFGDAVFVGWYSYSDNGIKTLYSAGKSFTPTSRQTTLYAKWELNIADLESAKGLANKLVWLQNNAKSGSSYTLEINDNETINRQFFPYHGIDNITITLRGIGANRTINYQDKVPPLFIVGAGATLVLDNNITLHGYKENLGFGTMNGLINVLKDGTLRMNEGSAINDNSFRAVVTFNGGTFTMNGGTISGNSGGVIIGERGESFSIISKSTFTMNGGSISGNTSNENGGGVCLKNGDFIMNSGSISNNTVSDMGKSSGGGGGIWIDSGTFTMNGGTISGNTARLGGGIYVYLYGTFNKTGGTITGFSSDPINGNRAGINPAGGHAVNANGLCRNTTAGPKDSLSFHSNIFTGEWDNLR